MKRRISRRWATPIAVLGLTLVLAAPEAMGDDASTGASPHSHEVGEPPDRSVGEVLSDVWNRPTASGDWGGLRTDLNEHGVYPRVFYTQILQGIASGGNRTNLRYGGMVDWLLDVDAEKLAGLWPGFAISLHGQTRYGKDASADAGGFVLPNTPLLFPKPGTFDGTEITGLTASQSLFDGQLDLVFGKLNVIDIWTAFYPNVGFGREGFLNTNALASAWPFLRYINLSIWGGGVWKVKPGRGIEGGYIFLGQKNVSTTWKFTQSFNDGVGMLGFWRFFWDIGKLPGSVMLAGLGATKKYDHLEPTVWHPDPFTDVIGPKRKRDRPWGAASYLYQELWHGSDDASRKAYLYMGGGIADKRPSFARWNFFASVEAIGALAIRKADRMGVAGWFNKLNDKFKEELRLVGQRPRDSWGVELYYKFAINQWLQLTADLQLVENATKGDNLAVIPGTRIVLAF